ncbi:TonB-dependent receptor [Flavisphingomonas formosensis]|uniref:TonB-dependent receptor n=1 Tax=Flavisphingomonas formosensis TaxID=861534 RepID=UPI0012FBC564|nr:TonB-dependent receptor [Sphingomonas formosensis]
MAQGAPSTVISGVEDIVVTAQKREQNLQVVPISITAISADTIKANRIQDVRDLSAVAPNLTVRVATGGSQQPNYTLRGILTGGSAAGSDKGVSLYLDGVYVQNVQGSIFEFADIERIEVLKGPQGTLFGRNATGGAISIITRNPSGKFGIKQDFTYGNYDQIRSKTRIDLPQFGPISASFTYLHSERRGDIRNLGAGTKWDYGPASGGKQGVATSPKWLGSDNVEAVSAAVKFDFTADLDLVYKFDYSENHYTPNGQGVAYLLDSSTLQYGGVNPNLLFLNALYNTSPNPMTPITNKRPKAVNNAYHIPSFTKTYGHNLTAKYQLNDSIAIKDILAYRKAYLRTAFQLDGLGGLINAIPTQFGTFPIDSSGPLGAPYTFLANNGEHSEKQWSNELQLNITTDWFNLTAGYLHFEDKASTAGFEGQFNTTISRAIAGQNTDAAGTPFVILGNPGYQHTRVKVISDAVFVQPEIHITDQFDIVGGARITRDKKHGVEYLPNQPLNPSLPRLTSPIQYRRSHATFLAGVNYRPTDRILTYAKYATGYISGGQLATITFKPETAKSWEAGIKADLFDRRFRSNLALFSVKYRNIQYTTSGQLTGVPSSFPFSQAVISTANAKAKGFEWENTIVPLNGLTLTANVGLTDLKFDQGSVFPGLLLQSGAPGYQVFQRPKWTGSLAAQYETPPVLAGGRLVLRADGNFRSRILHTSDITPGAATTAAQIPSVLADPKLVKAATTPFQWIVNARIALVDIDVAGSKAYVAAWGRNILNNRNITQFTGLGPVASVIYERAPTYGIDVGFEF